ncbi:PH domain-containing protein [Cryptosporidium muris RN66]|uniref:PH domain-containing protein n=2 Tax=Cryptosporidium TaxID=5806 RepID=B6A9M5_CRYMR|nr:PH domain-containing protein [Cryptosporidium muris RN66]EEA04916.1 PH domain-containing protein [Cryptosporidium muris RN66]OII78133.1 PH domain-containing protein [Cryptosporidium andersoni]|eukprot:XP_002139265.1 PH domain-containing protein [Cryptosporidium muris RN66]
MILGGSQVIIRPEDVVKQGWLYKQSRFLKDWRRRWFILTRNYLASFKEQGDFSSPTESLKLSECLTVRSADEDINRENAFRVDTPHRVFFLIAENPLEKEEWIGQIGRQMIRPTVFQHDY